MPIRIPNELPATRVLTEENIFVMTETRAQTQDIRPLKIALLNLMPTKIDTETQLSRLLGNTPLQVELTLLHTQTHKSKNTSADHLLAFYKTFDDVKEENFDGMIITGAPVELLAFEEVEYWEELCTIMEWTKTHVHSTFHICWGAQAALYYHYGIKKYPLPEKKFGVFAHTVKDRKCMLFRGFDDHFFVPHSRHTEVKEEEIKACPALSLLSTSPKAGVYAVMAMDGRQVFITGHSEYDPETLAKEFFRDLSQGKSIRVPENYFPQDNHENPPMVTWRAHANLLYSNWLNYYVYQSTPYDLTSMK